MIMCGMNFGNELQNDVVVDWSCPVEVYYLIYDDGQKKCFFDMDKLQWRKIINQYSHNQKEYEDEHEELTLQEISDQLSKFGITHCYLWCEGGLEGTIYSYNNYGEKEWLIHGKTKGYA